MTLINCEDCIHFQRLGKDNDPSCWVSKEMGHLNQKIGIATYYQRSPRGDCGEEAKLFEAKTK